MNVLTPLQRDFLFNFFAQPISAPFALTGGTALTAFYLRHRLSEDVDLIANTMADRANPMQWG